LAALAAACCGLEAVVLGVVPAVDLVVVADDFVVGGSVVELVLHRILHVDVSVRGTACTEPR